MRSSGRQSWRGGSAAAIDVTRGEPPLCAWRRLAIAFGAPRPFAFRTGIAYTPFEEVTRWIAEPPAFPN
jgi:hypothetical protein